MKKTRNIIIIFSFLISTIGCSTRLIVIDKMGGKLNHDNDGTTYYKGNPFTGIAVAYMDGDKSKIVYEHEYVHGALNGLNKFYYPPGKLNTSGTYKDGKKWNGAFREDAAPMVPIIAHYKNGKVILYTDCNTGKILEGEYRGCGKYSGSAKSYNNGKLVKVEEGFKTIWEKEKKSNRKNSE